jgi:hypothetical protein
MSKNSEKKNQRRKKRINREKSRKLKNMEKLSSMPVVSFTNRAAIDLDFTGRLQYLVDVFSQYKPADIILALSISDLWLPNISSPIRHQIAYRVLASMSESEFRGEVELDTYEKFAEFSHAFYGIIQHNPMLEDYIPEQDWGEVCINFEDENYKVFYGGNVERIPDFFEAFKIIHSNNSQAMSDAKLVLMMQNKLINSLESQMPVSIEAGHIEVPSELFWTNARGVLLSFTTCIKEFIGGGYSSKLFTTLGGLEQVSTSHDVGNLAYSGGLFRYCGLYVGGEYYLSSPRNLINIVIDIWSGDAQGNLAEYPPVTRRFNEFLSLRFKEESIIDGPFVVVTPNDSFQCVFSTLIRSNDESYLVLLSDSSSIDKQVDIKSDLIDFLKDQKEWRLLNLRNKETLAIQNKQGEYLSIEDLNVVCILCESSSEPKMLGFDEKSCHLFFLPDFITIFDSLQDVSEFSRFIEYLGDNSGAVMHGMSGSADMFASFRDSDELLVAGANKFDFVMLDTSMGTDWRFKVLREYWTSLPAELPNNYALWRLADSDSEALYRMHTRSYNQFSWSTMIGECMLHFVFDFNGIEFDRENAHLIETACQCFSDSIVQRSKFLKDLQIFKYKNIVINCIADTVNLAKNEESKFTDLTIDVFNNCQLSSIDGEKVEFNFNVNLNCVQSNIFDAKTSQFEYKCAVEVCCRISDLLGFDACNIAEDPILFETSKLSPRFRQGKYIRKFDVPADANVKSPSSRHFKLARKNLAIIFKELGVTPGKYELSEAKAVIDQAKVELQTIVHDEISQYRREPLLRYCISQIDALTAEYDFKVEKSRQSLGHEVDYDREDHVSSAYEKFSVDTRRYKYLLENRLYYADGGSNKLTDDLVALCLANIDWLLVLFGASDTLHNGIDVGGVTLDDDFIPSVFFSEDRADKEKEYIQIMASNTLGINYVESDSLEFTPNEKVNFDILNDAFLKDNLFAFKNMLGVLSLLAQWKTYGGDAELRWHYEASVVDVISISNKEFPDIDRNEIQNILNFLILNPKEVRTLLGRNDGVEESDVPIWDHFNRGSRYTIRPLIEIGGERIIWGAASVNKALVIWAGNVSSGYLPANYKWDNTQAEVKKIKISLEKKLESNSFEIFQRYTEYNRKSMDFMRKFKKEKFDDVGDFDVLAYIPDINTWIAVECKYNQPPYCMKDSRRLRDSIFNQKKSHVSKIDKRGDFLKKHSGRILELLNWPKPHDGVEPKYIDLYVSRETYWWMVNPPYSTNIEFVKIDLLDNWLKNFIK